MAEKMVNVFRPHFARRSREARVSRMCIPESEYIAELAAAENDEREPLYTLDEQQDDAPSFDGLSAEEQETVLANQAERAELKKLAEAAQ